jgi:hypothetical protein
MVYDSMPRCTTFGGQCHALHREGLDEPLGNNSAAIVTTGRTGAAEIAWFVDVDFKSEADPLGHLQQEKAEQRSRRPSANHGHPRTVHQIAIGRFVHLFSAPAIYRS